MTVLAFECSGTLASVAVARGGEVHERCEERPGEQLRLLFPMALELLASVNLAPTDLQRLAVTVGPGSFTGLRLAIATARTMAQVLDLPVVAMSTLDAVARGVHAWRAGGRLAVVTDARKGQVFARAYDGVEPLGEPLALDPPDAAAWLAGVAPAVVGGSGLRAYPQLLEAIPRAVQAPLEVATPRARHVALYALSAAAVPYTAVEPVYLRPPDVTPPKPR